MTQVLTGKQDLQIPLILSAMDYRMKRRWTVFLYSSIRLMNQSNATHKRGRNCFSLEYKVAGGKGERKKLPLYVYHTWQVQILLEILRVLASQKHRVRDWPVLLWSPSLILSAMKDLSQAASRHFLCQQLIPDVSPVWSALTDPSAPLPSLPEEPGGVVWLNSISFKHHILMNDVHW